MPRNGNGDDVDRDADDRFQVSPMPDEELENPFDDAVDGGVRMTPRPARRSPAWPVVSAVLLVAVLALAAILVLQRRTEDKRVDTARLEAQLLRISQRLDRLESSLDGLDDIREKARKIDLFIGRFERLEKTTAMRFDDMEARISGRGPVHEPAAAGTVQPGTTPSSSRYTVQKGDTLFSISRRYRISVERLKALNQLSPEAVIVPGQKLRVAGGDGGKSP